jgi:hypothetical protein
VRSDPDGLWSVVNYEFHCFNPVSFQGKLLCSIDNKLCVSYDDSLVTIGRAVNMFNNIGGELINMQVTSSGYGFYTACIEGTIVATVVNAESLAVFPPPFSVFISS